MKKTKPNNAGRPDITINEITAKYDSKLELYMLYIDREVLLDADSYNQIAFFDQAKKRIFYICQSPGLSLVQAQDVIKVCEQIEVNPQL